jgi:translocator protein
MEMDEVRSGSAIRSPRSWAILAGFLIVVIGVGGLIGTTSAPGAWYQALAKPPFNPPNWVFAPVWFTLYVLIGIAGWRTFLRDPASPAMFLWILQMILNWAWSPTWFSLHQLWPAFAIIVAILALIVGFIAVSWRKDRVSAWLFAPYAVWVAFASTLNLSIAILN